jgi:hypothetical protein
MPVYEYYYENCRRAVAVTSFDLAPQTAHGGSGQGGSGRSA